MVELLGFATRPTGMRAFVLAALLAVVLGGCGDQRADPKAQAPSTPTSSWCRSEPDAAPVAVAADLDGDGKTEEVTYAAAGKQCPGAGSLSARVSGHDVVAVVEEELPVTAGELEALRIAGHQGDVVLMTPRHPRGGFDVHLFGYADGKLAELRVDGKPVVPFVATDTMTTPLAATCTADGFDITEGRAHQPIGIAPAWDVYRTSYTVHGLTVAKGPTTEVADNVLDEQLRSKYRGLVDHSLFENCRAGSK
ncbi:hypothetical protein ACVW00_002014 [Marmoricola sp. URHA0025 HA25]